jgi:hypothetical protein
MINVAGRMENALAALVADHVKAAWKPVQLEHCVERIS